jgi:hypothetical protein
MLHLLLKFLHVLGAIVLLGTGAGIAFFMLMAHLSGDIAHIIGTAKTVARRVAGRGLSPPVPAVVRIRLSRIRCGAGDRVADGRQAGSVRRDRPVMRPRCRVVGRPATCQVGGAE